MARRWGFRRHSTFTAAVLVVVGLGTLALVGAIAWPEYVAYRASRWPQAEATVLEGRVVSTTEHGSGPQIPQDKVEIQYKYTVNGVEYVGTKFTPHGNVAPNNDGLQVLRSVKIGGTYPVRYNPRDPADSYFYDNYKPPEPVMFVCSGCPAAAAAGLIVFGLGWRRGGRATGG